MRNLHLADAVRALRQAPHPYLNGGSRLSVDVATTLDHQAADTAIGQITADALHIDVRAGADNNRRTTKLPTQMVGDFGRAVDQLFRRRRW